MNGMEFENKTFKEISCIGKDLKRKLFMHSHFDRCDFTETDFTDSKFIECSMHSCNLSLAKLDGCLLNGLHFDKCKFVGVNFCQIQSKFIHLSFKECLIKTCNFSDLSLEKTAFIQCEIYETYFVNANLAHADFSRSDLKKSLFHNTKLQHASFAHAINYSISPLTNALKKTKFSQPEVMSLLDHLDIEIV